MGFKCHHKKHHGCHTHERDKTSSHRLTLDQQKINFQQLIDELILIITASCNSDVEYLDNPLMSSTTIDKTSTLISQSLLKILIILLR